MRNIRKVYRIACIMIGKRKVHTIILGCIAAVLFAAYQNHFNLQMTVQAITDGLSEICTKIHWEGVILNLNQSGHLPYGVWHEVAKEPWPVPQKEEIPFLWCAIRYCDNSLGYGIYQYDFENHNWKVAWKNRDISLDSIVAWSRLLKHDYVPASLSDTMKNVLKIVKKHGYIFRNHAGLWTYPDCPINRTAEGKEYLEWSCQTGTLLALQNRGLITIKDERAFLNDGSGGKYYG